jgi:hypothetical protein
MTDLRQLVCKGNLKENAERKLQAQIERAQQQVREQGFSCV